MCPNIEQPQQILMIDVLLIFNLLDISNNLLHVVNGAVSGVTGRKEGQSSWHGT
jgi:hypothetical protein